MFDFTAFMVRFWYNHVIAPDKVHILTKKKKKKIYIFLISQQKQMW